MFMDDIRKLMQLLKDYDLNVWKHSIFVMKFSFEIMKKIDTDKNSVRNILIGSLLHDIGKLRVNRKIINKEGKLNPQEWNEIKKHPTYGASILNEYENLNDILPLILYHHERWDGKGYFGLSGKDICLGARIIAIADSVEAMSSERPYQKIKNTEEILLELLNNRGSQFDSNLINLLFSIEPNANKFKKQQGILEELIFSSRNVNSNIFYKVGC